MVVEVEQAEVGVEEVEEAAEVAVVVRGGDILNGDGDDVCATSAWV